MEKSKEEYIVAMYFFEHYHSKRCWDTVDKAKDRYKALKSEAKKLAAVREQILIRYLDLRWDKAHHPWSSKTEGGSFDSKYLFDWLVDVVIPLKDIEEMPDGPPVNMPSPPKIHFLGTTSDLALKLKEGNDERRCKLVSESTKERDEREERGFGDRWADQQDTEQPSIDSTFVEFKLEMLFEYPNTFEGGTYLDWAHGVVEGVVNKKTGRVPYVSGGTKIVLASTIRP